MNEAASLRRTLWANASCVSPLDGQVRKRSLLVWNGRIAGYGDEADLRAKFGPPDERIELEGRLLLPGLTDAHCHLVGYGVEETRAADLTGCESLEALLHRLEQHGNRYPGEWLLGRGFDQERMKEQRFPNREDLDARFPKRPVILTRICWHALVANSAAMERVGIFREDGLFTEDAMNPLLNAVPSPTLDEVTEAARHAIRDYNRSGFTSAHVIIGNANEVRALQRLHRQGELSVRVQMIVPYAWLDHLEATGFAEGFGDDFLRFSALKSFADGSLGARTAALRKPYIDESSTQGIQLLTAEELTERIRRANAAGLRSAVHAIGDAAVEALVVAAESTKEEGPPPRIEHASVVDPDLARRMGQLSMSAAVQPQFIASDFWTPDRLGPDRAAWAYPFKSLLASGVNLAGSTDCPVESPDASAVYRNFVHRADSRPEESLSPQEALFALTLGAARSLDSQADASFGGGGIADFLLLQPGASWPQSHSEPFPIDRMIVGGRVVHKASSSP